MQVYTGIDWSEKKHDVIILNQAGAILAQQVIAHTPAGFQEFDTTRQKLGIGPNECLLALETRHNLLVDFLWARGYTQVYVVPPNVVKSSRGRYRQSQARTDVSDARLLADLLRTDRHHLRPWHPDSELTQQMRAKISLYRYLSNSCVRLSNRLRAVLMRYYPAALKVFSHLDAQITLAFIQAYPTPQKAAELTFEQFSAFAREHRYPRPKKLAGCFARLQEPQPKAAAEIVPVYQEEATTLAGLLLKSVRAKHKTTRALESLFQQHPDYEIFASLPGTGVILGAGLLVKFGDDRKRFPNPASLQALAGTCPVTVWSGKRRIVKFRRSCDKDFRHIAQQWARKSLRQSVWANGYYQQVRPRCSSDNHAYRCLANRWLAVAWKLWQTRQPYDETYHLQQRAQRSKPK